MLDPALDSVADRLREQGHTVVRGPRAVPGRKTVLPPDRLGELVGAADVIVATSRVVIDDAVLEAAPRLRGVVFPSIGTESLDLADAGRRGLMVANGATPENFQSMAEATIMLMLNLSYDLRGTEDLLRRNAPRPAAPRRGCCKARPSAWWASAASRAPWPTDCAAGTSRSWPAARAWIRRRSRPACERSRSIPCCGPATSSACTPRSPRAAATASGRPNCGA
ncbi:hypothetical protein WJ971_09005 [Achromobacter xylosoxidans]